MSTDNLTIKEFSFEGIDFKVVAETNNYGEPRPYVSMFANNVLIGTHERGFESAIDYLKDNFFKYDELGMDK